MLRMARERFAEEGYEVQLLRQSFLELDPGREFDLLLCMHSGLDYVLDEEELAQVFVSFRRCVRPGGLLAFDKCLDEPEFYHEDYGSTRRLSVGKAEFQYHWDHDARRMVQRCTVTRTNGAQKSRHEFVYHLQATDPEHLEAMVHRAGFVTLEPPEQFCVEDPGAGIYRAV
jgi:SAM-dependent methyltransferase